MSWKLEEGRVGYKVSEKKALMIVDGTRGGQTCTAINVGDVYIIDDDKIMTNFCLIQPNRAHVHLIHIEGQDTDTPLSVRSTPRTSSHQRAQ
jgi:hypothetical protein